MSAKAVLLAVAAVALLGPLPALAEGIWFDIGSGQRTYVPCSTDSVGWEYFPPYPFGAYFPPGTLVYGDLYHIPCEGLPEFDCGSRLLIAGYATYFNDGGCGCGGYLVTTCRLRLHYDEDAVQALGVSESELLLIHYDWNAGWRQLENVVINAEQDVIEGDVTGVIIGEQIYAITTGIPTPVESTSWGKVKALYWH